eukprot:m.145930 g.145930  ORF g.145930 m.145930 type:complete len:62 (+) comp14123_c0_seq1:379-564(+)
MSNSFSSPGKLLVLELNAKLLDPVDQRFHLPRHQQLHLKDRINQRQRPPLFSDSRCHKLSS